MNPKHKGYEVEKDGSTNYDKPIDGQRHTIWTNLTYEEHELLMEYLKLLQQKKKSPSDKKKLAELEQRYLNEIGNGKEIDGIHADYVMCHGTCQRVYRRSRPNEEDKPKKIETGKKYHFVDGTEYNETVSIRKRKFVPFGLYCYSCGMTTLDEEFRLLEIEERKGQLSRSTPGAKIVQGYDNEGYFQKRFNWATL